MSEENVIVVDGKRRRQRVEVIVLGENNTVLGVQVNCGGMNSYVELPGGGFNVDETLTEAGLREQAEEAGWIVIDPRPLCVPGNNIFVENDNSWLMQHGYDEEESYTLVCHAVMFKPTELYNSEGDAREYKLMDINQVYKETQDNANRSTDKRGRFISEYRLRAFKVLFNIQDEVCTENMPSWIKWK